MRRIYIISLTLIIILVSISAIAHGQESVIDFDQVISGEITNDNPAVRYQFEGSAGDVISIRMNATVQGLDSYINLLDSTGEVISRDDDAGGNLNSLLGPFTLPANDTYTIEATRCCPPVGPEGSAGPFELQLTRAELNPVSLNERITLELNDETDTMFFTLDGIDRDSPLRVIANKVNGAANFIIDVRSPEGVSINSGSTYDQMTQFTIEPIIIADSGIYVLSVRRQANTMTGAPEINPVQLSFIVDQPVTTPLEFDTAITGVVDDQNPSVYYTFDATTSDLLRMSGSQSANSQPFEVMVFGPDGFNMNGASTYYSDPPGEFTIDPMQIFLDGQYTAIVRRISVDEFGIRGTSDYTFTIGPSATAFIETGVEIVDTVGGERNYEKVYRLEGVEGQTIRITLRSVDDSYAPAINVQGPSVEAIMGGCGGMGGGGGNSFILGMNGGVPATGTYEVTLPSTGTYLFRVNNGIFNPDGINAGTFGLLVEEIS